MADEARRSLLSESEYPAPLFRALVEASPDGVLLVDGDGVIIFVNAGIERMFGYGRDALVGRPLETLLPERLRDTHARHRMSFAADPHTRPMGTGMALWGRTATGDELPVDVSLAPVEVRGSPCVLAAVRDDTERRRAAEATARLAQIVEASYDGIFSLDAEGRVVTWNRGAERIFGRSATDAVGRPLAQFVAGDDPDGVEVVARSLTGERVDRRHVAVRRQDGMVLPLSLTLSPMKDDRGGFLGVAGIARDVSEQHLTQAALAEAWARLHDAQTLGRFGLWAYDAPTGSVQLSEELYSLLGVDPLDFDGSLDSFVRLVGADDRSAFDAAIRTTVESGALLSIEAWAGASHPELMRIHLRGHSATDASGAVVGVQGIVVDITEHHRAQEQLRSAFEHERLAVQRLEEADRLKDEFLSVVSHELRTPLASVIGFAEALLLHPDFPLELRTDALSRIVTNADEMHGMIERLLDFSRLTAGRVELVLERIDAVAELHQLLARFERVLAEHQLAITGPEHVWVLADRNALTSVLGNLITNAAKFSPPGSAIGMSFQIDHEAGTVTVSVSDHGVGIPSELQPKVFDRFFQAPGQPPGKRGTGVGLAIVKHYVELQGGSVWVESGEGEGTTFSFTMRAAP